MFKCKLHYFVCAKTKGGHTTDLWHDGIGIKNSKLQKKKKKGKEKQKAKYKSLILLIMISQQNNKSLSSIVS